MKAWVVIAVVVIGVGGVARGEDGPVVDDEGKAVSEFLFPEGVDEVRIPLVLVNDILLTREVAIDGKRMGYFVIDTGAESSVIDVKASEVATWPLLGVFQSSGAGGQLDAQLRRIGSLSVGPLELRNHFIAAVEADSLFRTMGVAIAGVIGGDVLSRTPYTIDYRGPSITFHRREGFEPPEGASEIVLTLTGRRARSFENPQLSPFSAANPDRGSPIVAGQLNGEIDTRFMLDTGSAGSLMLMKRLIRRHPELVSLRVQFRGNVVVLGGADPNLMMPKVDRITLFGREFVRFERPIANMLDEEDDALGREYDDAVAGYGLFHGFRMTFDYQGRRMWVESNDPLPMRHRIATGLDPREVRLNGSTWLHWAAENGTVEDVGALLGAGAEVNAPTLWGGTALSRAIDRGDAEIVRLLLDAGAEVGEREEMNRSRMVAAAHTRNVEIVRLLLDAGADVNRTQSNGASALHAAAVLGDDRMVRFLIERGAEVEARGEQSATPIVAAAAFGNAGAFDALLEAGARLDVTFAGGLTLIHAAAQGGDVSILARVVAALPGVGIDSATDHGVTPLGYAVSNGRQATARWLIERGADVNAADAEGKGMVYQAALDGDVEMLALLADSGADLGIVNAKSGWTAYHAAAKHGHPGVIRFLGEHARELGVDRGPDGLTPLMTAAEFGRAGAAEALLGLGADPNARRGSDGQTPIFFAMIRGHEDTLGALLRHGADPSAARNDGVTALMLAANQSFLGCIKRLLEAGAEADALDLQGNTALVWAAKKGQSLSIRYLIAGGADPDVRSPRTGATALHWAAMNGHIESVRALLVGGADPAIETVGGRRARHLAEQGGHGEVVKLLDAWGRK